MGTKTCETNRANGAAAPRIEIMKAGPYAVYGAPELHLQTIETDEAGVARDFRPGRSFATRPEPVHLCRCGASKNKPYCDGSHGKADWDPALTAPHARRPEEVTSYEGPGVTLLDDEPYCVLARFCDAGEGIWQAVGLRRATGSDSTIHDRREPLSPGGGVCSRLRTSVRSPTDRTTGGMNNLVGILYSTGYGLMPPFHVRRRVPAPPHRR